MVFYLLVVDYVSVVDPVQKVALLADNLVGMYISNQLIYVVFGIILVALALALYDRLKAGSTAMVQTATVFGLFWAVLLIGAGMVFTIAWTLSSISIAQIRLKPRWFGWRLNLSIKD